VCRYGKEVYWSAAFTTIETHFANKDLVELKQEWKVPENKGQRMSQPSGPEDGDSMHLRNVGFKQSAHTASEPKRTLS
jgi:hypothetical protein